MKKRENGEERLEETGKNSLFNEGGFIKITGCLKET